MKQLWSAKPFRLTNFARTLLHLTCTLSAMPEGKGPSFHRPSHTHVHIDLHPMSTGMDTKLMQNAVERPNKKSILDHLQQKYVIGILVVLACICILTAILATFWVIRNDDPTPFYLADTIPSWWETLLTQPFSALCVFCWVVPLTLNLDLQVRAHAWALWRNAVGARERDEALLCAHPVALFARHGFSTSPFRGPLPLGLSTLLPSLGKQGCP